MSSVDPSSKVDPTTEQRVVSFEELDDTVPDESLWGRDPFDVVAALEEELGYPIWRN